MKLIDFLALFEKEPFDYDLVKDTWDETLDTAGDNTGHGIWDMVETCRAVEDLLIMIRAGAFEDYRPAGGT